MTATATDTDTETIDRLDFRPTCEWRCNGVRCENEATHYVEYHDCTSKHANDRDYVSGLSCWSCIVEIRTQFFESSSTCCMVVCRYCPKVFTAFPDLIPVIRSLRGES